MIFTDFLPVAEWNDFVILTVDDENRNVYLRHAFSSSFRLMAKGGVGSAPRVPFSFAGSRFAKSSGCLWSSARDVGWERGCGLAKECGLRRS